MVAKEQKKNENESENKHIENDLGQSFIRSKNRQHGLRS